jgi:hypothetical protein
MPNTDQLRQLVKYAEEANLEVGRKVLEYIIRLATVSLPQTKWPQRSKTQPAAKSNGRSDNWTGVSHPGLQNTSVDTGAIWAGAHGRRLLQHLVRPVARDAA